MQQNSNWQCPYCGHHQVLQEEENLKIFDSDQCVKISEHGNIGFRVTSIACLNEKCKKLSLTISLSDSYSYDYGFSFSEPIKTWLLLPDSIAKPQPDYIPLPIRKDYEEACKIAHLSPNASAVLSRRCLEGMIQDFCSIKESSLYFSIEKLKDKLKNDQATKGVTEETIETIEAIDSIRKVGRMGAHMQTKTGMLFDIEPDEASLLVKLIETLFKEWYVAREERQKNLKNIQEIIIKKAQKNVTERNVKPVS